MPDKKCGHRVPKPGRRCEITGMATGQLFQPSAALIGGHLATMRLSNHARQISRSTDGLLACKLLEIEFHILGEKLTYENGLTRYVGCCHPVAEVRR